MAKKRKSRSGLKRRRDYEDEDFDDGEEEEDNEGSNLVIETSAKSTALRFPEGLRGIKLIDMEKVSGKFGEQICWTWEFLSKNDRLRGKFIKMWTPDKATPKNKTGKIIKALTGKTVKDGQIRASKLLNKRAKGIVADHTKPDGDIVSRITEVLPYK